MNTRAQFDVHPDAESLNAFAEQALGDREREEIMAHLAVCGRCRGVVFLAQEAAGLEMEVGKEREQEWVLAAAMAVAVAPTAARAESAAPKAVTPRVAWYRSWWMVWVPVGALAVIVALATVMHVRHVEQNSEMAKNVQVAPPLEQQELQPPAKPLANTSEKESELKAGSTNREGKAAAKGEARELGIAKSAPAGALSAPPAPMVPPPGSFGGGGASETREEGLMARSAAGRAESKRQETEAAESKQQQTNAAAAQVQVQAAPAVPPSSNETVTVLQADQIAVAPTEASTKAVGGLKATHGAVAMGTFAAYKAPLTRLPSGLPAVSTATGEHAMLGVDRTGDVFLSEDAGVHWEAVARQWNGRAVAVRKEEAGKKDEAGGTSKSAVKFELVNDEGKVWVSSEGRTWAVK